MSNLTVKGNASGTGTVILESPNTNTARTVTLPDATTTLVGTDATQTLTNKTINGGALTLATAQASTSGTAIDFTGIPAWVKRVTVMFNGVSTSGASGKIVQIGSATFDTSGYLGSESNITSAVGSAVVTNGFGIRSVAAADVIHGAITLFNITGNTWIASGVTSTSNAAGTQLVAGSKALSGVLDRVRITTAGGTDTFDLGSINIMLEG